MTPYGDIRVVTECYGLMPISAFDAVEIHPMVHCEESGGLVQAEENESPCAFSVMLHLRSGGVDTVLDIPFDASEPGAMSKAEKLAAHKAIGYSDMIRAADPELPLHFVLGPKLCDHPLASTPQSEESGVEVKSAPTRTSRPRM